MIYTSSSQSLSCLENIVHRSKLGLSANFSLLTISIHKELAINTINLKDLPQHWTAFENMHLTQAIGDLWIDKGETAILRVPSSIVPEEYNYLINPNHADFKKIDLIKISPFLFDDRIKN